MAVGLGFVVFSGCDGLVGMAMVVEGGDDCVWKWQMSWRCRLQGSAMMTFWGPAMAISS